MSLITKGRDDDGFPKSANWLWRRITPIRPNLSELGIIVKPDREAGFNRIILSKAPKNVSTASMSPQQAQKQEEFKKSASINASTKNTDTSSASTENGQIYAQHGSMETVEADLPLLDKKTKNYQMK